MNFCIFVRLLDYRRFKDTAEQKTENPADLVDQFLVHTNQKSDEKDDQIDPNIRARFEEVAKEVIQVDRETTITLAKLEEKASSYARFIDLENLIHMHRFCKSDGINYIWKTDKSTFSVLQYFLHRFDLQDSFNGEIIAKARYEAVLQAAGDIKQLKYVPRWLGESPGSRYPHIYLLDEFIEVYRHDSCGDILFFLFMAIISSIMPCVAIKNLLSLQNETDEAGLSPDGLSSRDKLLINGWFGVVGIVIAVVCFSSLIDWSDLKVVRIFHQARMNAIVEVEEAEAAVREFKRN